ncbi:MocE family 2Fe-2S type ferredoxin [Paenibacillus allorhizosphaerae]|uniref:Naphthalene 1,2-dioxygenase/salicylate 5-hydroxylase systems, ferredoxin component n=1 Tax=Paenibacillus allorhizosphaerae TaxID=2849866 RepID=A0ABM8VG39_9BACL|nr:MocE family 2Fe-2S type ferredoxin [Paenibacillus allorhizosphaerae]CAG7636985.1 Naphthalene 1,2-dioxygenase/salicylate 5-hydroxylase systems, ferredoxin component [Paenibacillus allorhizosphaerae]
MEFDGWIEACSADDIALEDVIRFDYGNRSFAIYRTANNEYFATDGYCTHQKVHLEGGLVMGRLIECPKHNGRFDLSTGEAKRAPACTALRSYPVKVASGSVYLKLND